MTDCIFRACARSFCGTILVLSLVGLGTGCGDDESTTPVNGPNEAADSPDASRDVAADAGSSTDADGGQSPDATVTEPAQTPLGMVVVNSDYTTTSVSLLDRAGSVTADDCINSGSTTAALNYPLSGDVSVASQPQPNHEIVLIDDSNAVVTYLAPSTCAVLRQWSVATGFTSRPHDVLGLSPTKAYVSRYEQNLKATTKPDDFDDGNDVLIVNPSTGAIAGRIDMSAWATADTTGAVTLPRADRMVAVGGRVYVSLNNLSANFATAGIGRVVIVDPSVDKVVGTIDLPALQDCSTLQVVPGQAALLVACEGNSAAGAHQIDTSGSAWIDLSTQPPTVTVAAASPFGNRVVSGFAAAAFDQNHVFAVTDGDFSGPATDALWIYSFPQGTPTKLYDAAAGFSLGTLLVDPEARRLFVLDASTTQPAIQIFDVPTSLPVQHVGSVVPGQKRGLPPRVAAWF